MKTLAVAMVLAVSTAAACSSTTASPAEATTADGGTATAEPDVDAGEDTDAGALTPPGGACSSARNQLLVPIDKVSQGLVSVVSSAGGVRTIYVDAAAGGQSGASKNPRVYVDLSTGARVDLTDKTAATSTAWDLAIKRSVIFTNSGDGGPGQGGAADSAKSFDAVTSADATGLRAEEFFDAECNALTDAIGGPLTNFADWYDYDPAASKLTPKPTTWIVRGGTGKLFKMKIVSFTAKPDGSTNNTATGYFLLEVADL